MDAEIRQKFDEIHSKDKQVQNDAYENLMKLTSEPVDWAYEVWDELIADLSHEDNHYRAIASQLICQLALSDPQNRMQQDFEKVLDVTRDERFVTARHCLQSMWKIGLAGDAQKAQLLDGLERRFQDCASEKNCTLIRFDIGVTLRNLYDATSDENIKSKILAWNETEEDPKYRKKYATVWKK